MSNQIFVTGDTHRDIDILKLNTKSFPDQKQLTRNDYLIICGDFGCIWYGEKKDKHWLDWHQNKPYTTLFCDGNHENFDLLNAYPKEEWSGGTIHRIRPNIIHLMRGQIYNISDRKIFVMGGASSHDIESRIPLRSWWPDEMPSALEYNTALENLDKANWNVDTVITHSCPDSIQSRLANWYEHDKLTNFLETVYQDLRFNKWYFGHYHIDRTFPFYDARMMALYQDIEKVPPLA